MKFASAILWCLLIGGLIAAPLSASATTTSADTVDACCGYCPDLVSIEVPTCCPSDGESDADSPCESDCGQCPCCVTSSPSPLAILTDTGRMYQIPPRDCLLIVSDRLSSRSDEPLLPPPRG